MGKMRNIASTRAFSGFRGAANYARMAMESTKLKAYCIQKAGQLNLLMQCTAADHDCTISHSRSLNIPVKWFCRFKPYTSALLLWVVSLVNIQVK